MKTKYKFIYFEETEAFFKKAYWIKNNKSKGVIGAITWYEVWHQYVFDPHYEGAIFSESCLLDIIDFLKQLNGAKG